MSSLLHKAELCIILLLLFILHSCKNDSRKISPFKRFLDAPQKTREIVIFNLQKSEASQIRDIPSLRDLKNLHSLSISGYKIERIPGWLSELEKLDSVSLRDNSISWIEDEFFNNENLLYLNVSGNKLKTIPSFINKSSSLQFLSLADNPLTSLPKEISELRELLMLDIGQIEFDDLESELNKIGDLDKLTELNLSWSGIQKLPNNISKLKALQELNLRNNPLSSLPEGITKVKTLRKLDISETQITSVPDNIHALLELEELDLSLCDSITAKVILKDISKSRQLKILNISNCGLRQLPEEIGDIRTLEEIHIGGNDWEDSDHVISTLSRIQHLKSLWMGNSFRPDYIPVGIGNLQNLESLYISIDKIDSVPSSIGQLKRLKSLYIFSISLGGVANFGTLDSLTYLSIRGMKTDSLPLFVYQLKSLKNLYFSGDLKYLSAQIGNLKALEFLDLSDNELIEIPREVSRLKNLQSISLEENKLNHFPFDLHNFPRLTSINLSNNLFSSFSLTPSLTLQQINLSNNKLSKIPSGLDSVPSLRILNLQSNFLTLETDLNPLTDIHSLQELNLRNNKIESIPVEFVRLTKLSTLDLSGNPIRALPDQLYELNELTQLKVDNIEPGGGEYSSVVALLRFFSVTLGVFLLYCSIFLFEASYGKIENRLENYLKIISTKSDDHLTRANAFYESIRHTTASLVNKLWGPKDFALQSFVVSAAFTCGFFSFYALTSFADHFLGERENDFSNPLYWFCFIFIVIGMSPLLSSFKIFSRWISKYKVSFAILILLLTSALSLLFHFFYIIKDRSGFQLSAEFFITPIVVILSGGFSTMVYIRLLKRLFLNSRMLSAKFILYQVLNIITIFLYVVLVEIVPVIVFAMFMTGDPNNVDAGVVWLQNLPFYILIIVLSFCAPFILALISLSCFLFVLVHKIIIWCLNAPLLVVVRHQLVRNRKILAAVGAVLLLLGLPKAIAAAIKPFLDLI